MASSVSQLTAPCPVAAPLTKSFLGRRVALPKAQVAKPSTRSATVAMGQKKSIRYVENWERGEFTSGGQFVENVDTPNNFLKLFEKKKLFSTIEKAGVLSAAEKAGVTLTKIENAGLLSKAEQLGLLSFAETMIMTPPATVASYSIIPFVLSILSLVLIPGEDVAGFFRILLSGTFFAGFSAIFITAVVLSYLTEDPE
eukprot:jgi/Mesvir1/6008/Mv00755-RA.1